MKFTKSEIEGVKRHPVIVELFAQLKDLQEKKYRLAEEAIKKANVAEANYNLGLGDQIKRTFELLDSLGQDAQVSGKATG